MGRRFIYFCDGCGKDFGDTAHINVKNGSIYRSFLTKQGSWQQNRVPMACHEYHFHDEKCLAKWFKKKVMK
jgi:hypothetical protein